MISLVYGQSRLSIATIFLYTCVWIPFIQIKHALLRIVGFVLCTSHHDTTSCMQEDVPLPVAMFGDLASRDSCRVDEMCSICLVEFEREDAVTQLSPCAHVFHMGCIQGWQDRCQFTCPLCRAFFFSTVRARHNKCADQVM